MALLGSVRRYRLLYYVFLQQTGWRLTPSFGLKFNEALVRNKLNIDHTVDPPPDLAIEMDVTHSSLDKMAVYAELKVPEVWRWQSGKLTVNILTDKDYVESETSLAFGSFPVKGLARFMQLDPQKGENARLREFRQWVRQQL